MTRTKKQLENILLVKTAKRFKRTKQQKISLQTIGNSESYGKRYTLEVHEFKFELSFLKNLSSKLEEYKLWIIKPDGYLFETFESDNENYAPILKQMYEGLVERMKSIKIRNKEKEEREFNRRLRKLNRII